MTRWAALAGVATLGASCQLIHGIDEYQTETTDGSGTTAQSSSAGGAGATAGGGIGGMGVGAGGNGVGAGPPPTECMDGDGVCLAGIPEGWEGYFSLYTTPFGSGPEQCVDQTTPLRFYAGPSSGMAQCSPCGCGSLAVSCNAPIQAFSSAGCVGIQASFNLGGGCKDIGIGVVDTSSVETGQPTVASATCDPSGGIVIGALPPMWTEEHSLCGAPELTGGTCAGGETCVDKDDAMICIKAAGDIAGCPSGWQGGMRITSHVDGADGRGCEPCSCAPPGGNLCAGGTFEFFTLFGCNGNPSNTVAPNTTCGGTGNANGGQYVPPPIEGSCTPGGGSPSGAVAPGQAMTLCCR